MDLGRSSHHAVTLTPISETRESHPGSATDALRAAHITELSTRPSLERVEAARKLLQLHRHNETLAQERQLLLDFDSTVYPLLSAMERHPLARGVSYESVQSWGGLIDDCGGRERLAAVLDDVLAYEWMREHPPFDGVQEAMERMRSDGVRVRVVSDRSPHLREHVQRYLDDHQIHYDSVLCQSGIDKINWCVANQVTTAVDDNPNFLAATRAAGISALSLSFIYNREALIEHSHPHAEDWVSLADHLSCVLAANVQRAITDELASHSE